MRALLTALFIFVATAAFADVGTVFETGADVDEGATFQTTNDELVHIELVDGTMIVVGPNTKLKFVDVDFASKTRFSKLAIDIEQGTMRFISGKSAKSAYVITTPSSTMGVQGTSFDLVASRRETHSIVFEGRARLCRGRETRRGECMVQPASCTVASTTRREIVARRNQDRELRKFQLLLAESRVRQAFREGTEECSRQVTLARNGRIPKLGVLPAGNDDGTQVPGPTPPGGGGGPTPVDPTPVDPTPTEQKTGNGNSTNTNGKSGESQGRGAEPTPDNQGHGGKPTSPPGKAKGRA